MDLIPKLLCTHLFSAIISLRKFYGVIKLTFDKLRISDIDVIIRVFQPAGKVCAFENRPNYGLLFAEYGHIDYECNGVQYPSDSSSVIFIPKGINYTLHCTEESATYVINFSLVEHAEIDTIQCIRGFQTSSIFNLLVRMERIWTLHAPADIPRTLGSLYEIIARLSEAIHPAYRPHYKIKRIAPSCEYLEQNFSNPEISNDLLSSLSGVSTVYFRKLFTEIFNISPMKYVYSLRIEKARALLRSGYSSVGETAAAVGFTNVYHFSRYFKQIVGISPSQYMEQSLHGK